MLFKDIFQSRIYACGQESTFSMCAASLLTHTWPKEVRIKPLLADLHLLLFEDMLFEIFFAYFNPSYLDQI